MYLSGCVVSFRHPRLGFILTPRMRLPIPADAPVAADNGCFSEPAYYSDDRYQRWLRRLPADRTLFATAPDVLADHAATVARSVPILRLIRALGLPAAFVAQDGWQEATTPWDDLDVLFIGGTTAFKFRCGRDAAAAAHQRGKRVHFGRANSLNRLRAALSIGCNSADGTFLKFAPDHNVGRMQRWFDQLDGQTEMVLP